MLAALEIRNVVLIEQLSLDFGEGLGVLTGETGAGKSILLDSLGLALGARGDTGLVRVGAGQAQVTAVFSVDEGHEAFALLGEQGIETEGCEIVLRRIVRSDGGSRAFVNDQSVSAQLLRDVGGTLIEIHGQHDERGLLNPKGHRALLDAFAGIDAGACGEAYRTWRDAEAVLAAARESVERDERDREFLEHAVAELRALRPEPGEEETLAARRSDMLKGQKLVEDLDAISGDLDGSDGGLARLRTAARRLDRVAGEHPLLGQMLEALDRALVEAGEAEDHLRAARDALWFDPAELDASESRLFELRGVARKHRVEPDRLADLAAEFEARAAAIAAGEAGLAGLERKVAGARAAFVKAADALGAARRAAAERLDRAMAAELPPLKLEAAKFRTVVESLPETQWSEAGTDRAEFEISTNPGAPFGPLMKIASGGELSRFMLALKVALSETRGHGTLIFDEIDRGVGGATASAIGERLARLAEGAQVLVVTHSPQVAARGAQQFRIEKASDGNAARTAVVLLDAAARREEIARMLSGAEVTDEARAQAERLLA
ncbi:DNA repair protein RecN [Sphingosinicella microcystinivorans]|uniref:DNA repair protein RecN n=1 Tax=Sphingosinicella microcystinivorans TaxID=335406 RepID=A0AAD1D7N1_SPHMI|nr:DNA repair protein RecN [Sphingosinicella microcystinivorans]RKS86576.1 DNA replication and repair protein RecN [Sphingosinicella microcystinivorans]BBE35316.1 DNA repair protein RecN [Sphingosinicella microcystinivorans]